MFEHYQLVPLGFGWRVNCPTMADACKALERQCNCHVDYEADGVDRYVIFDTKSGRDLAVAFRVRRDFN